MGKEMKPQSSLKFKHDGETRYSVHFDDGITIVVKHDQDEFEYLYMLSVGLNTYYTINQRWPGKHNINSRVKMAKQFIERNIKNNRYKKSDNDK